MNTRKTALSATLASVLCISTPTSADIISISFNGLFTMTDPKAVPLQNIDYSSNDHLGFHTDITGTATFDAYTGTGTALIDPFSFLGGGLANISDAVF